MYLRILAVILVLFSPRLRAASGEREAETLKATRAKLLRPTPQRPEPLSKRQGLSAADLKWISSKLPQTDARKIEQVARQFWAHSVLHSLLGMRRHPRAGDIDSDDEWISEIHERIRESLRETAKGGASDSAETPVAVFLSQSGFNRQSLSEEMTALTGREALGGVALADFFEDHPGRNVPAYFSQTFSPWDFGVRLASSTRLDATLLSLMNNPDPFSATDSGQNDELSDSDDDAWSLILDQLEARVAKGEVTLAEMAAKVKSSSVLPVEYKRLMTAAAVSAVTLKTDCALREGVWREVYWNDQDDLILFACAGTDQSAKGPMLKIFGGDLDNGRIEFSLREGGFELKAETTENGLAVSMVAGNEASGNVIYFWDDGSVRAVENLSAGSPGILFARDGQVEWIERLGAEPGARKVSFYPGGAPKSLEILDAGGAVSQVGYYQSGQPKFYFPLKNGKPDGNAFWWHASGQLAGELSYSAGKRFGVGRLVYQNGIEGFRAEYGEDLPHGRMIWRDPTGRVLFSLGFSSGKAHGLLELKSGGRTIAEARFDGGVVDGTVLLRNAKGITVASIPYKSGAESGQVIFRDSAGNSRARSEWVDGRAHGPAEAFYSSGTIASRCLFVHGKLKDWISQRPDGSIRYKGKTTSDADGVADVDFYLNGDSVALRCQTKDWKFDQCFAGSHRAPIPALKDLLQKVTDSGELSFKPEKCGGAVRAIDVSELVGKGSGVASLTYRVKEICRLPDLATGLDCEIAFTGKSWSVSECILTDEIQDED